MKIEAIANLKNSKTIPDNFSDLKVSYFFFIEYMSDGNNEQENINNKILIGIMHQESTYQRK